MDKEAILKTVLNHKLQINNESLNYIYNNYYSEDKLLNLINFTKTRKSYIITLNIINEFENELKKMEIQPILVKESIPLPEKISIEELIQDKILTYEKVKDLLRNRWELINITSINKITKNTKKFSLIAEVIDFDKNNKIIELQDNTKLLKASVSDLNENLLSLVEKGDILGFVCENNGNIKITNIIFPDIPLFKASKTQVNNSALIFSYGLFESEDILNKLIEKVSKEYNFFHIFDFEDSLLIKKELKNVTIIQNTEKVKLFSIFNFNVLLSHQSIFSPNKPIINQMINFLKKRIIYYHKINNIQFLPFIIDIVPDFFVTNGGNNIQYNYKNTILLSIDKILKENIFYIIDLNKQECLKMDLF